MDRLSLVIAFANRDVVTIKGITGIISSMQHEDGSGYSFNLVIGNKTVYYRCAK